MKNLFITKKLSHLEEQADGKNNKLKRHLGPVNLTLLGVGCTIGAGIFVLTGPAAQMHAGPALTISFAISAFGCLLAGLCYAEFASMIPVSGSAYTYGYATMGEFIAWIIGWDLILEYLFGASTVAVGWSGYFNSLLKDLGITLPDSIRSSPFVYDNDGWHATGAIINFPAVFIVILMTALLVVGIKESARFNNIIVFIKTVVILLFIGAGLSFIHVENWTPFIPENTGTFGQYGWSGIMAGAGVVFFAYVGFDAVSTTSQEAINPKRDMPIAILGSLFISTLLYVAVTLVLTGIVNYKLLNVDDSIAFAVDYTGDGLKWLRPIVKVGPIIGMSSVVLVLLLGQSRVLYAMANDGLIWKVFKKTHVKYKTPYLSSIITGALAAIIAGLFPVGLLGKMVSIGTLLAFVIVCIGIIIMRKKEPHKARAFKTPWVPFVPILGALVCFGMMAALPLDTWLRLFLWMGIGFLIYFFYGRKNSHARKRKKEENSNR